MSWKSGPLPENTWGWGGCVRVGDDPEAGFFFADFQGDKVIIFGQVPQTLKPDEVLLYDNSLTLPHLKGCRLGTALNPIDDLQLVLWLHNNKPAIDELVAKGKALFATYPGGA